MRYRFLRFPGGLSKAVTISYDDNCRSDFKFVEIINKYGIKGTFNVMSGKLNHPNFLNPQEIKDLILDSGHEVAVHGQHHVAPGLADSSRSIIDIINCRVELEKAFGKIIRGMAYPDSGIRRFVNGSSYENVKNNLKSIGIVYSRTLAEDNDLFELPNDWHAWMPSVHNKNPELFNYIDKFLSIDVDNQYLTSTYPRLFYMWGHSYEFEGKWDELEAICQKLGGHDDVWYATNIEIYDYVKAYDSLIFSADNMMVYNPTLITVWFKVDGNPYVIKPGETIEIID